MVAVHSRLYVMLVIVGCVRRKYLCLNSTNARPCCSNQYHSFVDRGEQSDADYRIEDEAVYCKLDEVDKLQKGWRDSYMKTVTGLDLARDEACPREVVNLSM